MGNYISKLFPYIDESQKENNDPQTNIQQESTQGSEISTPVLNDRKLLVDPRSATAEITRTPIQVNDTPIKIIKKATNTIPKYLQRKQYLETDLDTIMPPLTPKKTFPVESTDDIDLSKTDETRNHLTPNITLLDPNQMTLIEKERYRVLGLDPRSPAADFDRTPILLPRSLALLKARSHKNADRKGSYETDVYDQMNLYQKTDSNIVEIRLTPDIASEDLKILNAKIQDGLYISRTPLSDTNSSTDAFTSEEEDITVVTNPKLNMDKLLTQLLFVTNEEEDKQDMKATHMKDDNRIKIWHDTSSSSKENVSCEKIHICKMKEKDSIEEKLPRERILRKKIMFDGYDTENTLLPKLTKIGQDIVVKEDLEDRKQKILKIDIKSDEKKIFGPGNRHGSKVTKSRTPLSNRSTNGQNQGTPMKSPQQLLKSKAITTKMQQENTPPQRYTTKTKNEIHWDSNKTVVI